MTQKPLPRRARWLLYICAGIGFGIVAASVEAWHRSRPLLTSYSLRMGLFGAVFFSLIYGIGMEVLRRRDHHPDDEWKINDATGDEP